MERSNEDRQIILCVPKRDDSTHHNQAVESATIPFAPFGTNVVVSFMNSNAEYIHRWSQISAEPVFSSMLPARDNSAFPQYRESQMNVMDVSDDDDSLAMKERVPGAYQKTTEAKNGSLTGSKSFASRMMAKMGYREGQGLGKHGGGRSTNIEVQQRPLRMGSGVTDPQMTRRQNVIGAVADKKISRKARKALRIERKKAKESTPRGFRDHLGKKSGPNMMPLGAPNRIPSTASIAADGLTASCLDMATADSDDGATILLDGGGENLHPHRLAFLTNANKLKCHVEGALPMEDHDRDDDPGNSRTQTRKIEFNGVDNQQAEYEIDIQQIEFDGVDNQQLKCEIDIQQIELKNLDNLQIESEDLNEPQVGHEDIRASRQRVSASSFEHSGTFTSPVAIHAEMKIPLLMLNQNIKERQRDDFPDREVILSALGQENGEGQLSLRSGLVIERGELLHSIIPWNEVRKENELHRQKDRRGKVRRKKKNASDEHPMKIAKPRFKAENKKRRYSKGERKRIREFNNSVLEMAHSLDRCWLGKTRTTEADLKMKPFRNLSDQASKTFWAEKQRLFETNHSDRQRFQADQNDQNASNSFEKNFRRHSENENGNFYLTHGIVETIKSSENPLVLRSKYNVSNRKVEIADASNDAIVSSTPDTKGAKVSSPARKCLESGGAEVIKGS